MPRPVLTSFNSGELSPLLDGRSDLQKYSNGCRTLENFLILPQGGVERRPGTEYIGNIKSHNEKCRLIPFVFSEGQSAVLEFGHLYMRVWRNGGQVLNDDNTVYELTTEFTQPDVFLLQIVQSADVIYIAQQNHHPKKLSRNGWADWEIKDISLVYGAFKDENVEHDQFITPSFPVWATATNYKIGDIVAINDLWSVSTTYAKDDIVYKASTPVKYYKSLKSSNTGHDPVSGNPYWSEHFQDCYRALTAHTSGASHLAPPGNTVDWEQAESYFAGSIPVTLTATHDIFTPDMVGGLWLLRHPREDNAIEKKFKNADIPEQTKGIRVRGNWTFITHGNWGGSVGIERSFDGGLTWQKYREYGAIVVDGMGDRNVDTDGVEDLPDVLYRTVRYEDADDGGTCNTTFTVRDYLIDGSIIITEFIDEKTVKGTIVMSIGSMQHTNQWAEGSWSEKNGYPSTVTIFEERLVFAGSIKQPQTLWFSMSNDYENFSPGEIDNDAMTFTIASDRVDAIKWIIPKQEMLIGTSGGEWKFGASKSTEPLTPTNLLCRRQSTYGSGDVPGLLINDVVMFLQEHEKSLREMAYSFEKDIYVSPNLTVMSEHICATGIVQMAYQRHPYPIVWCVRRDGQIGCLTYNREEELVGWSRIITDGLFESVAVITGDTEDEVWVVVNRTIGGVTKRYMERFEPRNFGEILEDSKYLDSHLSLDLSESTDIQRMYSNYGLEENATGGYVYGSVMGYHAIADWDGTPEYINAEVVLDGIKKIVFRSGATAGSGTILGRVLLDRTGYEEVIGDGAYWPNTNAVFFNTYDLTVGMKWTIRKVLAVRCAYNVNAKFARFSGFTVTTDINNKLLPIIRSPGEGNVYYVLTEGGAYIPMSEHPEFDVNPTITKTTSTTYSFGNATADELIPGMIAAYKFTETDALLKGNCFNNASHKLERTVADSVDIAGKDGKGVEFQLDKGYLAKEVDGMDRHLRDQLWVSNSERMLFNFWINLTSTAYFPTAQEVFSFRYMTSTKVFSISWQCESAGKLTIVLSVKNDWGYQSTLYVIRDASVSTGFHMITVSLDDLSVFRGYLDKVLKNTLTAYVPMLWYDASPGVDDFKATMRYAPVAATTKTIIDEFCFFKPLVPVTQAQIDALYNSATGRFISSSTSYLMIVDEGTYTAGGTITLYADTLTGLSHLEGKVVEAVVDGACHKPMSVSAGQLTTDKEYNVICVGLPYVSILETMRIEADAADGGSQASKKRATEVTVRFINTVNGKLISPEGEEDIMYFRNTRDPMTRHIPLFTGDKKVKFSTGFNTGLTVTVKQDTPMPMTVLLISPKMWVYQ